ncbi:hypothetical protein [Undibacterium terreum]|uniref:Lipoprotein n=1 Tax=Undibacterium terreum TaxID=1224302 RepID=A0A916UBI5_9BURK|nr:hypothetical protein [Undibacterium terreum]GGC65754.1 hypothetical protein GCM10011396_10960 [Undibacterium terreum]
MRKIAPLLILSLLAGCAGYQAPKQSESQSTLNIDGEASLTAATNWMVYDNPCQQKTEKSGSVAVTGNVLGRHKQVLIRAGEPVYLIADTKSSTSVTPVNNQAVVKIGSCAIAMRFTPEAGKTYDTKLAADQCSITLLEHQSGKAPAGARILPKAEWGQASAVCKAQ